MPRTHEYYVNFDVARKNGLYRRVLYTVPNIYQSVVMSLAPGETIPTERHEHSVQGFFIVSGRGKALLGRNKVTRVLKKGVYLSVKPNVEHTIRNTSKTRPLVIFTFYVPPEHAPSRRNRRQPRDS